MLEDIEQGGDKMKLYDAMYYDELVKTAAGEEVKIIRDLGRLGKTTPLRNEMLEFELGPLRRSAMIRGILEKWPYALGALGALGAGYGAYTLADEYL